MSPSNSRASRAALRAKYRKPKRRRSGSTAWNVAIVVVVVAGIVGVMLARSSNQASADKPPLMADPSTGRQMDHWHAFLGVDVCGEWLPNAPAFEARADNPGVNAGIHSHGDGLIHIHPFVHSEEGDNATVGRFLTYGGWKASSDSIELWAGPPSASSKTDWEVGDRCTFGDMKGKDVELSYTVNGKKRSGDPADYRPQNGDVIAIYLLPKGSELPEPPDAQSALSNISDVGGGAVSATTASTTTATTAPASSTSSP